MPELARYEREVRNRLERARVNLEAAQQIADRERDPVGDSIFDLMEQVALTREYVADRRGDRGAAHPGAIGAVVLAAFALSLALGMLVAFDGDPTPAADSTAVVSDTVTPRERTLRQSAFYDCLTTMEPGTSVERAFEQCGVSWPGWRGRRISEVGR